MSMTTRRADTAVPYGFELKSFDEERRVIQGWATTPTPDRVGDVVEPMGLKFAPQIPLFLYHDSEKSVGSVMFGPPTKKGVPFEATLPKVLEAGNLKDRVDEAWQMVKYKLIQGVSIGFKPVADKIEQLKTGGLRFMEAEVLELSLVPIPMNAQAVITAFKSADELQIRTASGAGERPPPGATGTPTKPANAGFFSTRAQGKTMTIQEQIAAFEAKRAANAAAAETIMTKAAEAGETLNAEDGEKHDGLMADNAQIDKHLSRLRDHEKTMVAKATPVQASAGTNGDQVRGKINAGDMVLRANANLPKGMGMARYVKALAFGKGNHQQALEYAKQWDDSTPEVSMALKTAVAGGTTTDTNWALPLVYNANLTSEFVSFLRPQTIIGKINGLRQVPFNVRFPTQSSGSTVGWVGEAAAKPVSKLQFSSSSLGFAKAAGIVVITQELARFSSPSAELLVRDDLTAQMVYFLDQQFIDPSIAAVANTNPASILNLASNVRQAAAAWTSMANVLTDVKVFLSTFAANEISLENSYWIMTPDSAMSLGLIMNTGGTAFAFPGIDVNGGTFLGLPVIVSNSVPHSTSAGAIVALVKASEVFLADDGQVAIDVSQEASLQMDSAPSQTSATPTASTVVSMFQTNSIAIRAERIINWARRRSYGVGYIDNMHTS